LVSAAFVALTTQLFPAAPGVIEKVEPELLSVQSPLTLVNVMAPVPDPPLVLKVSGTPKVALVELVILKALWETLLMVNVASS
jgi:hypothetical protein